MYTSYSSTNQKSSTTAVPYDTEFRIQIRKIVRYEVPGMIQHKSSERQKCLTDAEKHIPSCSTQTDSPCTHHKAKFLQATVPRSLLFLTGHDHFGEHGRSCGELLVGPAVRAAVLLSVLGPALIIFRPCWRSALVLSYSGALRHSNTALSARCLLAVC